MKRALPFIVALALVAGAAPADEMIKFTARSQTKVDTDGKTDFKVVEKEIAWNPKKTAIIICDMWDDHWCKSAARRVGEMAPAMNDVVKQARAKGVFIIHAPSSVVDFYKDTSQRALAQKAKFAKTPVPLSTKERWGTGWCWPQKDREGALPIDDSDMGCSCKGKKCEIREAWTRQVKTIELVEGDALTHDGQETFNLLEERGIDNVILMGVHLNMCVLGRPFGIRQMVDLGKNVVLMRDLTDTMYNPEKKPFVSHFAGTDLVIAHVEKFWCPSVTSTGISGKPPFVFKEASESKAEDAK